MFLVLHAVKGCVWRIAMGVPIFIKNYDLFLEILVSLCGLYDRIRNEKAVAFLKKKGRRAPRSAKNFCSLEPVAHPRHCDTGESRGKQSNLRKEVGLPRRLRRLAMTWGRRTFRTKAPGVSTTWG